MSTPPQRASTPLAPPSISSPPINPTPPLILPLIQTPTKNFHPRLHYHFIDDPPLVPSPSPSTHTLTLTLSSDLSRITSAKSFSPEYQIREVSYEECERIGDDEGGEERGRRSFRVVCDVVGTRDVREQREDETKDLWERVEKLGRRWEAVCGVVGFGAMQSGETEEGILVDARREQMSPIPGTEREKI